MVDALLPADPEDLASFRALSEAAFLSGQCAAMAVALHRCLGEPIVGLELDGRLVHAGTRAGAGFRDVRGVSMGRRSRPPTRPAERRSTWTRTA